MTPAPARLPFGRLASWLITSVVLGWLVVYNVLRFGGADPGRSAGRAFLIGAAVGLVVFGLAVFVRGRLASAGRIRPRAPLAIPESDRLADDQRSAMRAATPFLALLASVGVGMGVFLAARWLLESPEERSGTVLLLAAWNLLVGGWLSDEYVRLRRLEAEGLDAVGLGAVVTAVLASVGLARDIAPAGQIGVIILAGVTAVLVYVAVWRLSRRGGVLVSAVAAALVAVAALAIPLTL